MPCGTAPKPVGQSIVQGLYQSAERNVKGKLTQFEDNIAPKRIYNRLPAGSDFRREQNLSKNYDLSVGKSEITVAD